ncbi:cytochrome P450 [Podospora appendiculata]|uniref:Cytochrome P450 n=1 Tax=Podospora appendiculata TaxID=314037 RepID=A0AAE0XAJ7_9PEZI|nr:cytochrome P450 [Podospora appendiculata]
MAENQATEALFDVAEQLLEWGIFMLKGLIPIIWLQSIFSPLQFLVLSVVVLLGYFLWTLSPPHDPAEPPLVKPKIPVLGHLIGLARSKVSYYSHISFPLPHSPSPTANFYVLLDPILQQAAIKIVGRDKDMESSHGTTDMEQLGALADTLNAIGNGEDNGHGPGVEAENLFHWLRKTVSRATSKALWGERANPYLDGEAMEAQWNFDTHMDNLLLGFFPIIVARTAYYARKRVNAALEPYYRAHYDQDDPTVSEFVRGRARVLRSYGLPDDEIAKHEVSIMIAATTDAIPTLFWCIARMFVQPDLLAEIRTEEYLRLASQAVIARRVLADTTVSSPDGQTYLLKANTDVIMPAKVVHRDPAIWGANDADTFNPRRFLDSSAPDKQLEKDDGGEKLARLRKAAFVPFGGGRSCVRRGKQCIWRMWPSWRRWHWGSRLWGLDDGCLVMGDTGRGGIASPVEGMEGGRVVIRRREGWEGVVWSFG